MSICNDLVRDRSVALICSFGSPQLALGLFSRMALHPFPVE